MLKEALEVITSAGAAIDMAALASEGLRSQPGFGEEDGSKHASRDPYVAGEAGGRGIVDRVATETDGILITKLDAAERELGNVREREKDAKDEVDRLAEKLECLR